MGSNKKRHECEERASGIKPTYFAILPFVFRPDIARIHCSPHGYSLWRKSVIALGRLCGIDAWLYVVGLPWFDAACFGESDARFFECLPYYGECCAIWVCLGCFETIYCPQSGWRCVCELLLVPGEEAARGSGLCWGYGHMRLMP
jgi:hypothetical protein